MRSQIDIVNEVLRSVRVTGSLQFCLQVGESWQTDPDERLPGHQRPHQDRLMCFHILVDGQCWLRSAIGSCELRPGDIVALPFGDGHDLGAGKGDDIITVFGGLPDGPWQEPPVVRKGGPQPASRLICGYLHCDALHFPPMRRCLPPIIHVHSRQLPEGHWLRAAIHQLAEEMEQPRSGGLTIIERLTETMLVELLRYQLLQADAKAVGWLTALGDPGLSRCMAAIHADPMHDWSLNALARKAGLSRSVLAERFTEVLGLPPMSYVREWRLYLASVQLKTGKRNIASIAEDAGYGTEAAFSRAFAKSYGMPPAAWRKATLTAGPAAIATPPSS